MVTLKEAVDSYNIDYIEQIEYLMHNDSYQIEVDNVIYLFTNILDDIYIDIFDNVKNVKFLKNHKGYYSRFTKIDNPKEASYYQELQYNLTKRNLKDTKKIMYTYLKMSGAIDIIEKEYNFKLLSAQLSKKDNKQATRKTKI